MNVQRLRLTWLFNKPKYQVQENRNVLDPEVDALFDTVQGVLIRCPWGLFGQKNNQELDTAQDRAQEERADIYDGRKKEVEETIF